ncbi:MAG: carbon-nitrogen hydrolase [Candidatus Kapabacteria bacterium]|nr:carbon-nitrogen hydrolase [Candidatus Kapabacteria bacterium]
MKISVIQFEPLFRDKQANIAKMTEFAEKSNSDLLIYPELCTSGYFFLNFEETKSVAESSNGETASYFKKLSKNLNKIIIYGFPEIDENGKIFNSAITIFPNGLTFIYRKTHLFYKEFFAFEPGNTGFNNFYYEPLDVNIGVMICYDWRFPEAARTLALKGADIIVCPSNLITDVWHISMPSRALENKVYLAVANRTGEETRGNEKVIFKGESAIWGYNGELITRADSSSEIELVAEIFPEKTRKKSFNEFNDIFLDRKPEYYSI